MQLSDRKIYSLVDVYSFYKKLSKTENDEYKRGVAQGYVDALTMIFGMFSNWSFKASVDENGDYKVTFSQFKVFGQNDKKTAKRIKD